MLKAIKAQIRLGPDATSTLRAVSQEVSDGGPSCHQLKGPLWD